MSIIKNPQVKFQGYSPKDYHFPKYPGKFLVQTQKLKDFKALKNYLPSKVQKQAKFSAKSNNNSISNNAQDPSYRNQYKQMNAQRDYIKRMQELKKKLQKQIKRYNKQKRSNEQRVRSLSLSVDHKQSMMKLQSLCVNTREGDMPLLCVHRGQEDKMRRRQSMGRRGEQWSKNKISSEWSYKQKNMSEMMSNNMRRRYKTEQKDLLQKERLGKGGSMDEMNNKWGREQLHRQDKQQQNNQDKNYYYRNKTQRLSNSQVIKLPLIVRKSKEQKELRCNNNIRYHSYHHYSFNILSSPQNLSFNQTQLLSNVNPYNKYNNLDPYNQSIQLPLQLPTNNHSPSNLYKQRQRYYYYRSSPTNHHRHQYYLHQQQPTQQQLNHNNNIYGNNTNNSNDSNNSNNSNSNNSNRRKFLCNLSDRYSTKKYIDIKNINNNSESNKKWSHSYQQRRNENKIGEYETNLKGWQIAAQSKGCFINDSDSMC